MKVRPEFITQIFREDLGFQELPSEAFISNVQHVSSYNWINAPADKPTIVVPGSPPLWNPSGAQGKLAPDQGFYYVSQNGHRHPSSPFEPLFRALYTTHPNFDINSIDFVSDRINIRKLLAFVDRRTSGKRLEEFAIDIEVQGDTVMFHREETVTSEFLEPGVFSGYGHNYRKANTTELIEGSTGHYRIITYDFAGKKFLVRYSVEAFVTDSLAPIQTGGLPTPAGPGSKLFIKEEGTTVPHQSTLEIRTRTGQRRFPIKDIAAHIWVSQTPNFLRAAYTDGTFREPVIKNVTGDIRKWEAKVQETLRRFSALLEFIARLAKLYSSAGKGNSTFKLKYSTDTDNLTFWKVAVDEEMLPDDLYAKWTGGKPTGRDSSGTQETDTLAAGMNKLKVTARDDKA